MTKGVKRLVEKPVFSYRFKSDGKESCKKRSPRASGAKSSLTDFVLSAAQDKTDCLKAILLARVILQIDFHYCCKQQIYYV